MFIKQAYKGRTSFWRYIVGSIIIIIASVIGQLPFGIAVFMKEGMNAGTMDEAELMGALEPNLGLFLLLISFLIAGVGLWFVVKFLHDLTLKDITTTRSKVDWNRFGFGFLIVAILTISLTVSDYVANPEDYVVNFKPIPFLILCVIAIILVPIQTSVEELVFRGYLMQGFGILAKNRGFALILTSLIFGGLHFFNPEVGKLGNLVMISYIGTGFLLGIMTLMDEGMELALGFHAGNNLIAALLVTTDWTVFQTHSILKDISEPSLGLEVLLPVLVVYPLILIVMARKYGWSDWKHKLFGKVDEPVPVIREQSGLADKLAGEIPENEVDLKQNED
ncbi:CPBP family intramembrane glutamic endopeptidase [Croceiramulus getboli]|nr:CPBP family intramembrane metalloprotease [Flavobacteriaceae bacterium YJPT1-3]